MPDPAHATVDDGTPSGGGDDVGLQVGQRWRDLVIEAPVPGARRTFLANHIGLMEQVVVRAVSIGPATEWRRGAWERLVALRDLKVVPCLEAHEEAGWRYEITAVPPAMTLREWMKAHRPNFAAIEEFMRQMAAALGALHTQGVVHLNLRPETIFVKEAKGEPVYVLGGLQEATLYTQPELMVAEVDPFYAPPEAAGLTRHPPGTGLCAWDWWTVGRVVQEFLLGKHVLSVVLDRDVSQRNPELRRRAEQLLLEREPAGVKAGALEFTSVDAGRMALLRGLLSSAAEARWGLDAVQRWLRHEPVRDHYDLPRGTRMWSWKGRVFTLAEAAEFFTTAQHWETGEHMLFHPEDRETLAHFLKTVPAHRDDWERLRAVCDLAEGAGWEALPVVARRPVTAAMAWLVLAAGAGARPVFRVRGCVVDLNGLGELLRSGTVDVGVALVTAMFSPVVIQRVERHDPAAAWVLKAVAAKGGVAIREAINYGWFDADDAAAQARMLELALVGGAALREKADLLRATHVINTNADVARLFAKKSPNSTELVLLAYASEAPERHGFITHEEWRRRQCAALQEKGQAVVRRLVWLRLRGVLAVARPWGGNSKVFAMMVLGLTTWVGWVGHSALPAAIVAAALLGSRVWLWWRVRWSLARFAEGAAAWAWSDGWERCGVEAERAAGGVSASELKAQLREIRRELDALAKGRIEGAVIREPVWWDVLAVVAAATLVTIVALAQPWWKRGTTENEDLVVDVTEENEGGVFWEAVQGGAGAVTLERLLATGRYEVVDDGFGRRLRGPLEPWTHRPPAVVPALAVKARAKASAEQSAFALVSGALLLHPYPKKGVNVYLAVRVPTTRGFGVMIFNARDRELASREVLLVERPPEAQTWHEWDRWRVLYLGTPVSLEAEFSLAPP